MSDSLIWAHQNITIHCFNHHRRYQFFTELPAEVSFCCLLVTNVSVLCHLPHSRSLLIQSDINKQTGVSIVSSTACSGVNQRKHRSTASLAFVRGIQRRPLDSPHKGPVTRKMFPFDDVIKLMLDTFRGDT